MHPDAVILFDGREYSTGREINAIVLIIVKT